MMPTSSADASYFRESDHNTTLAHCNAVGRGNLLHHICAAAPNCISTLPLTRLTGKADA